mmetsp:Transcript_9232/g.7002  ORF Transcript_9232/g.7002 Transcript_9232/m.7002 type:complete len:80 (-) Transcript_9232:348-587(-)
MKRLGDESSRFGSVSISAKKLAQGAGHIFMHWVTLFDELDDDLFDGQLGEDDQDLPRILLEYSIVGGKYTAVLNSLDSL